MLNTKIKKFHLEYWLYLFILIHVIAWTLAPLLVRFNLPMDAMEGTTWGHQFEWGYDKNPFMNAWLTTLAVHIGGQSAIYFFSQLSVAICFFATWLLAKKMLQPLQAVVAVLLLEGVQYYTFHAIDFNDNTLELGFWALTILFFYQATTQQKCKDWLLTGIFAGCAMMTKYFAVMLLLPMLLFLCVNKTARNSFKQPHFYLGLISFLMMIAPHFIWLFSHHFVTVDYAFNRVDSPPTLWNHIFFPAQFAWQEIETFLPVLLLLLFLIIPKQHSDQHANNKFDQAFLLLIGIGPFLLTILLSAFTGIKLRAGWGQPLLSLWGIILMMWLQPHISLQKFYRFVGATFTLLALMITGYCVALIRADEPSSANYPGKNIAATLTEIWQTKFHTPLTFVAGSRWLAGNIAFYSKDHPSVYMEWNKTVSPWIDEKKLKHNGAIFVWDLSEDHEVSVDEVKKRFPKMGALQKMHFVWMRNQQSAPVEINLAFLPPE